VSYDFIDPKYWFDRAEEVRIRSDLMRDPGNRETMLRIAADYERLGQRAVNQAKRYAPRAVTAAGEKDYS
jgi:hypothetical protein